MDRVQQNGGIAGIVAAVLLVLFLILQFSLGPAAMTPGDPAAALAAATQKWGTWVLLAIVGLVVSGVSVVFVVGLAARLRSAAPTRSSALLYLALIGLAGYALGSSIMWLGGAQVVEVAGKDPTAATHAWVAFSAVSGGLAIGGTVFTGAAALVAGWAIIGTGAMAAGIGWLGLIAGAVNVLTAFAPASPLMLVGGTVLVIAWLAWTGSALRAGGAT